MSNAKLIEYQEWMEKAEEAGCHLLEFKTPCCDKNLKTMAPSSEGSMWDSFTVCPHCSEPFLKEVYVDRVVVLLINNLSTNLKIALVD